MDSAHGGHDHDGRFASFAEATLHDATTLGLAPADRADLAEYLKSP